MPELLCVAWGCSLYAQCLPVQLPWDRGWPVALGFHSSGGGGPVAEGHGIIMSSSDSSFLEHFFKTYYLLLFLGVLSALGAVTVEAQRSIRFPGCGVPGGCYQPGGCWKLNPGQFQVEEQPVHYWATSPVPSFPFDGAKSPSLVPVYLWMPYFHFLRLLLNTHRRPS